MSIFTHLIDTVKKNGAAYVVLIDPDKNDENSIQDRVLKANESGVDALFVHARSVLRVEEYSRRVR